MWVYALAIAAAFLFAAGSVVQQRAASEAPPEKTLSFALLLWLVRRPSWLIGVVASLVGNLLSAAALGIGGVALVQPLLNVRLLFALGIAAVWSRVRLTGRDWGGAVAAGTGLGLFVYAGRPHAGDPLSAAPLPWLLAVVGGAVAAGGLFAGARRLDPARQATLLAAGAGVLFGLQASLTEFATDLFRQRGVLALLVHWQPYALVLAALTGAVLIQSAYEMAPLTASYPALVTTEPLAGILIGVMVLGGRLRTGPVSVAAEAIGLAVMTGGVYLLATSPLITGQLDALRRRREEGEAFRVLSEIEERLERLRRDMHALDRDSQRRVGRIKRYLARAEEEMAHLRALQQDMPRHRAAEREHIERLPPKERMLLEPLEQELDERELQIDAAAERLGRELGELREECRALEAG